jgi:protein TonB
MAHAAPPLPFTVQRQGVPRVEPQFELDTLVFSGPRSRSSRKLGPTSFSIAIHVLVVASIVVLPVVVGEDILPVTSDAVRAFFVPPPDVSLPPPPPPPPAGARLAKPAPAALQPAAEAKFTAPIDVPDTVQPEESIDLGFEGGVPGGVEGGVPGGVVGGIVGGLPSDVPPPAAPAPVRVGGMISAPKLVNRVNPEYPEIARAARTTAILILEATVGPDGRVTAVQVVRGQPLFDASAVDAVKQWRYQPLLLNGVPVPFIVTVTLNFNLVRQGSIDGCSKEDIFGTRSRCSLPANA